jgi:hypothetical protein
MRKRLLGALFALLAGVATSLVVLPGTSYASTGFTTTGGGYLSFNSIWESTLLGNNWRVGDCTMLGNYTPTGAPEDARTYARIVQPDSSGQTYVYIFEATQTAASPTDVWWTTLTFYTAFGTPILTTPKIAGAQMTTTNHIYIDDAWAAVTIDPQLFPLIAYVSWSVSC